jgi:very-short-patch-repair endonuclease
MIHSRTLYGLNKQTELRKQLRKNLTPAEAALWSLLKGSQLLGRKFRRQHGIGSYIVDFCCPSEHLIVELDGEVHNDPGQAEYDAARDANLRELGFTILRFENKEVFRNTQAVLNTIAANFSTHQ